MLTQLHSAKMSPINFGHMGDVPKKTSADIQIEVLKGIASSLESLAESNKAMLELKKGRKL